MKYTNVKTGAVVETTCEIKGGDWVAEKPAKATKPASTKAKKEK